MRKVGPLLKHRVDSKVLKARPKEVELFYRSPEYERWRAIVIARAGGRCEAITNGQRCTKAQPVHRMFADHKIERSDGGAPLDPANGQCLCGSHHTLKTVQARASRLARPSRGGGGIKSLAP
ncbi:MAG: HNH endonuclease signature motif containing protein [Candidatus Hydrogenedentales bacterium]